MREHGHEGRAAVAPAATINRMKIIFVLALIGILAALASAGMAMVKRPPKNSDANAPADSRMARALAVRVGLSVALFLLVLLGWSMGWISPHGVPFSKA